MTRSVFFRSSTALSLAAMIALPAAAQDRNIDALTNLPTKMNRSTPEAAATLREEMAFQQATQAYLWAMPEPTSAISACPVRMRARVANS